MNGMKMKDTAFKKKTLKNKITAVFCLIVLLPALFLPGIKADADTTMKAPEPSYYCDKGEVQAESVDMLCNWGGASALFVWVSLMQLSEQGKISLTDAATDYLPETFCAQAGFTEDFTILDLMNHTAGFQQNQAGHILMSGEKFTSLEDWLITNKTAQVYTPGAYMAYSDYGITLSAYVIENVTGMSYTDYVHSHILKPLGMEYTSVYYDYSDNSFVKSSSPDGGTYLFGFYPAYSARGNLSDMALFVSALMSKEDDELLKAKTKEEFFSTSLQYRDASKMGDARCAHGMAVYYQFEKPVYGMYYADLNGTGAIYITEDRESCAILYHHGADGFDSVENAGLFGHLGYCDTGKKTFHNRLSDLEGSYIKADTVIKGQYSFSSLFSVYTLKALDDEHLALSARPQDVYMTQISSDSFQTADGEVGHFYSLSNGTRVIEFPYFDLISYPKWIQTSKTILLVFYFIGLLYSSVVLLIAFIKLIVRLIKKQDAGVVPRFRKYHYIQSGVYLFHGIIFQMMAFSYMMGLNGGVAYTSKLMFYLGTVMSFVYGLFFFRNGMKEKCGKTEKEMYWITFFCGVLQIVFSAVFGLIFSK